MTPKISNKDMLMAKDFLNSLKQDIIDNKIGFSDAAKEFSSDKETRYNGGLLLNPNTNNAIFSIKQLDPTILNEIELMSVGEISDPIYIKLLNGQEAYRIIKLVAKQASHVANLKDDYPFLKNDCFMLKQEKELKKWYSKNIKDIFIQSTEDMSNFTFYNNLLKDE